MSRFEIYLTNLGRYNEGCLVGAWVKLPVPQEKLQEVFAKIQIDGRRYEEYFITDVNSEITGIACAISEYSSITTLNSLAEKLDELEEWEKIKLQAILECESTISVYDVIDLVDAIDDFDLLTDVSTDEELGYYYIDELCFLDIPEHIKPYFDFEIYGRDVRLDINCTYTTFGFLIDNR